MDDLQNLRNKLQQERAEQARRQGRLDALEERLAKMGYPIIEEAREALADMVKRRDEKAAELQERWNEYQSGDSEG